MNLKSVCFALLMTTGAFASDVPSTMNPVLPNIERSLELDSDSDLEKKLLRGLNKVTTKASLNRFDNFDDVTKYIEVAIDIYGLDEDLALDPAELARLPKEEAIKLILKSLGAIEKDVNFKTPNDDEGLKAPNDDEGLKAPNEDDNL